MKASWINGQTEEQAAIIRADFIVSLGARRRLETLIQDKVRVVNTTRRSKEGYNSPNWPYVQADAIGYERALCEVISLISDLNE